MDYALPRERIDEIIREVEAAERAQYQEDFAERGKTRCFTCGDWLAGKPGPLCVGCREDG